jgi:hypothetical protein
MRQQILSHVGRTVTADDFVIVGMEMRGVMLGAVLAHELQVRARVVVLLYSTTHAPRRVLCVCSTLHNALIFDALPSASTQLPFIPMRKVGAKLPGDVIASKAYKTECGYFDCRA